MKSFLDDKNLLAETKEQLARFGWMPDDVCWVGSRDGTFALSWDEFAVIANEEYDNDYGSQEVANDLVVVGTSWWLERHEYDGSEWWEYKILPQRTKGARPFARIFGYGEGGLAEMNRPDAEME